MRPSTLTWLSPLFPSAQRCGQSPVILAALRSALRDAEGDSSFSLGQEKDTRSFPLVSP